MAAWSMIALRVINIFLNCFFFGFNPICHASTAPSVYENVDVKKGILLQLFSGARKEFTNSGRGRFR